MLISTSTLCIMTYIFIYISCNIFIFIWVCMSINIFYWMCFNKMHFKVFDYGCCLRHFFCICIFLIHSIFIYYLWNLKKKCEFWNTSHLAIFRYESLYIYLCDYLFTISSLYYKLCENSSHLFVLHFITSTSLHAW